MADIRGRDEDGTGNVQARPTRPVWVWVLVVIFVVALVWMGFWLWGGHSATVGGSRGTMARLNSGAPVTDANQPTSLNQPTTNVNSVAAGSGLPVLDATDKNQYVGKTFAVTNVQVTGVPSHGAFWISAGNSTASANSAPMLVLITTNTDAKANPPTQGQLVDVTGTVEKAPSTAKAKKDWSLSSSDAAQLEKQGAYVQASEVAPAQPQS